MDEHTLFYKNIYLSLYSKGNNCAFKVLIDLYKILIDIFTSKDVKKCLCLLALSLLLFVSFYFLFVIRNITFV